MGGARGEGGARTARGVCECVHGGMCGGIRHGSVGVPTPFQHPLNALLTRECVFLPHPDKFVVSYCICREQWYLAAMRFLGKCPARVVGMFLDEKEF